MDDANVREDPGVEAESVPSVRVAVQPDAAAVWPLAAALATSYVPTRAVFERTFTATLADPDAAVLVAEVDRRVVGYLLAFVHPTFFADAPVGWIEELMVDPDHRRSGIGARLVAEAEGWAGGRGAAYLALATRRAADFYTATGYEQSATFYLKLLGSAGQCGEDAGR